MNVRCSNGGRSKVAGGAKVRWQPNVGGRRPRVVVEGHQKSCSETERGTTAGVAWPEARRHGGRRLAWFSRRKSRREKDRQRRQGARVLAWFSRWKSRREKEETTMGWQWQWQHRSNARWWSELAERNRGGARARKKGGSVLSPN